MHRLRGALMPQAQTPASAAEASTLPLYSRLSATGVCLLFQQHHGSLCNIPSQVIVDSSSATSCREQQLLT